MPKCGSRLFVKEKHCNLHRMVDSASGAVSNIGKVGCAASGSVCNKTESPIASLCVSYPLSESLEGECHGDIMNQPVCICIPPMGKTRTSSSETGRRHERNDSHSSNVAK